MKCVPDITYKHLLQHTACVIYSSFCGWGIGALPVLVISAFQV